uniref:Wall-associated receptor kinase-like 16 n=1 Tax=Nelumbo nucifera TaxID=4432 RepID=A0A822ZBW0_NELNU|nr:TPA_asm: hypothetical protein HUJ06_000842 [Nelumbo nucifera]
MSSTLPTAKPCCQDRCGDVTVPYPFGLDDNASCYREGFNLHCDRTSDRRKLLYDKWEVLEISVLGDLRILNPLGYACYNKSGYSDLSLPDLNVADRPFTFSDTKNRFTAIGCDTDAYVNGSPGREFTSGCSMTCYDPQSLIGFGGNCTGMGCCKTFIPKGFKRLWLNLESFYNHSNVLGFNPCSYCFVVDYSCECFNSPNGLGYLCKCSPGYHGNPYLDDGCQDVNECADEAKNECKAPLAICTNMPGSYTCSCPSGWEGDGRKNGTGCTALQNKRSSVMQIALGTSFGVLLLLFIGSWLYWGIQKRKQTKLKEKFFQQNGGILLTQKLSSRDGNAEMAKIFTEEELKKATNNYDESRILGRGGYGIVYKGCLPNNRIVAIKKSKIKDESQVEQFINEVVILSQINHKNVVKLLGCCLESEVPMLVYEFITNGTLSHHIHDEVHKSSFSWEYRLRIGTETALALAYLHSAASPPIIHRDIKSANILLDDNYMAKVSDFGASRLVPLDQTQFTTLVQGTMGYLDPEYFQTSQLTEKSDVYSFGVVLVELLTGRKALEFHRPEKEKNLATYFITWMKEGNVLEILEDRLLQEASKDQLRQITNLAKRCLNMKGEERPTMKEVAMELEELRMHKEHLSSENNDEEAIHLLIGEPSNLHSCKTSEHHSIRDHVVISLNSGR